MKRYFIVFLARVKKNYTQQIFLQSSKCCQNTPKNSSHMSAMLTSHVDEVLLLRINSLRNRLRLAIRDQLAGESYLKFTSPVTSP